MDPNINRSEMDPNTNLDRQREVLAELRELSYQYELAEDRGYSLDDLHEQELGLLVELSKLAESLDEWLSKGGFAPLAWQQPLP